MNVVSPMCDQHVETSALQMTISMAEPANKKRRFLTSDEEPSLGSLKRSELWYSDGSIVFRAEDTLFRVYKGILATQSLFFRDLFSLSLHEEDEDTIDGCPIIRVYDTARDFEVFLQILHNPMDYVDNGVFSTLSAETFNTFASILRLADKYDVDQLKQPAMKLLRGHYPNTLREWDILHPNSPSKYLLLESSAPGYSEYPPLTLSVFQLARELNLREILPAVVYECCFSTYDIEPLLDEIILSDGAMWSLSWPEKRALLLTREAVLQAGLRLFLDCFFNGSNGFESYPQCPNVEKACQTPNMIRIWARDFTRDGHHRQPLSIDMSTFKSENFGHRACSECTNHYELYWSMCREHIWECLEECM